MLTDGRAELTAVRIVVEPDGVIYSHADVPWAHGDHAWLHHRGNSDRGPLQEGDDYQLALLLEFGQATFGDGYTTKR